MLIQLPKIQIINEFHNSLEEKFITESNYICLTSEKVLSLHPQNGSNNLCRISAAIAQSVEHFIRNEKVVGSSPTRGSKITKRIKGWCTSNNNNCVSACFLFLLPRLKPKESATSQDIYRLIANLYVLLPKWVCILKIYSPRDSDEICIFDFLVSATFKPDLSKIETKL